MKKRIVALAVSCILLIASVSAFASTSACQHNTSDRTVTGYSYSNYGNPYTHIKTELGYLTCTNCGYVQGMNIMYPEDHAWINGGRTCYKCGY